MDEIPHFSLPLRIERARAVTVEQDSPQHIGECVEAAARTELGWRIEAPDFGIPPVTLQTGGVDLDALQGALVESEPRASVIAHLIDGVEQLRTQHIRILIDGET